MMDIYMVGGLAALYSLFYVFAKWCNHVIDDKGGAEQ